MRGCQNVPLCRDAKVLFVMTQVDEVLEEFQELLSDVEFISVGAFLLEIWLSKHSRSVSQKFANPYLKNQLTK